jgi:hypothetical protein
VSSPEQNLGPARCCMGYFNTHWVHYYYSTNPLFIVPWAWAVESRGSPACARGFNAGGQEGRVACRSEPLPIVKTGQLTICRFTVSEIHTEREYNCSARVVRDHVTPLIRKSDVKRC